MGRGWLVVLALAAASTASAEELPNAVPTVMYKRWAAAHAWGLGLLHSSNADPINKPVFYFDFALRFRVVPTVELGASAVGEVRRSIGFVALYADARYRFMAERPWNPYVLAGVGMATYDPDISSVLVVRGGLGLERRFKSWAFASELQLARVGNNADVMPRNLHTTFAHHGGLAASVSLAVVYHWGGGGPSLRRHGVP